MYNEMDAFDSTQLRPPTRHQTPH